MNASAIRPLRILYVFRAPVGGLFRNVYDVVKAMAECGHHVGILCDSTTGGERGNRLLDELAPLMKLGIHRLPMHRNPHPTDVTALRNALSIMQLARPHFSAPQLDLGLAEVHLRLKEHGDARRLVEGVLAAKPDLLVSPDMSCMMHLGGLAKEEGKPIKTMHLAQVLRDSLKNAGKL